jgi:hypothetical protein
VEWVPLHHCYAPLLQQSHISHTINFYKLISPISGVGSSPERKPSGRAAVSKEFFRFSFCSFDTDLANMLSLPQQTIVFIVNSFISITPSKPRSIFTQGQGWGAYSLFLNPSVLSGSLFTMLPYTILAEVTT